METKRQNLPDNTQTFKTKQVNIFCYCVFVYQRHLILLKF